MTIWTSPTLRGEQVLLRPLGAQDTNDLWTDVQDPEGRRLTGTHHVFTYKDIADDRASRADKTDRITLAVTSVDSAVYRGEVVLMDHDEANRSASLRIGLAPDAHGQGLGVETLRLVRAHAFGPLALHRVSLEVFDFNAQAIHAYEKIGFRHEGRMRDALWWDGAPHGNSAHGHLGNGMGGLEMSEENKMTYQRWTHTFAGTARIWVERQ